MIVRKLALLCVLVALLPMLASARPDANVRAIEARDMNWAPHAGLGEDFNIIWRAPQNDINADNNYLVRMQWRGTYADLNWYWDINSDAKGERIAPATMNAASVCFPGQDANVIRPTLDLNRLIVPIRIQSTLPRINAFVGKEVILELWKVIPADATSWQCLEKDANVSFVITPALIVSSIASPIDSNVTVMGYGFTDANVLIKYVDSNFAATRKVTDLNILDVNYSGNRFAQGGLIDVVFSGFVRQAKTPDSNYSITQGGSIVPDANGNFDVNIIAPFTTFMPSPGTPPDSNIMARGAISGDVNTMFIPTPGLTMPADMNVTVMICNLPTATTCYSGGTRKNIEDAMRNNDINDMEHAKGFIMQMGSPLTIRVAMNSDVNMAKGPRRDYSTDTSNAQGKAEIDTTDMPEFAIDANITMFNVQSYDGTMPILARNGWKCGSMCTNIDGTPLSSTYKGLNDMNTWNWNSTRRDGNIMFRVSTFSSYGILSIDMNISYPNAGNIYPRYPDADGNVAVTFQWADTNVQGTPVIKLAVSDVNGDFDVMLLRDFNLADPLKWAENRSRVECSDLDGNALTLDANCTYDLNITTLVGAFYIDINIMHGSANPDGNSWLAESSDYNFIVNAAKVTITDTNLSSIDWNFTKKSNTDANYWIDFNVLIPLRADAAVLQDANTIDDYNFSIYVIPINPTTGVRGADINVGVWSKDGNLGRYCTHYSITHQSSNWNPVNCSVPVDFNALDANRYIVKIDVNYGHWRTRGTSILQSKFSDQNVIINDINSPTVQITRPAIGLTVTTSSYTLEWSGIDTVAGVQGYWWRTATYPSWNWLPGSTTSYTLLLATGENIFYLQTMDKVDINSSTVQVGITYSPTAAPGGAPGTPGGGGGGAPPVVEKIETILEITVSLKPTGDEIRNLLTEAGASETAIERASAAVAKTTVERTIKVEKLTYKGGAVEYKTTITFVVKNASDKTIKKVKVIEKIPKSVISHLAARQVEANVEFEIIKADPILKFTIDEIKAGESFEIVYSILKKATESEVSAWLAPVVSEFEEAAVEEEDLCVGVVCEEKECKAASCDSATGECVYENLADGTACSIGTCQGGRCIEAAAPPEEAAPPVEEAAKPLIGPEVIIILVIIVAAAGLYYYSTTRKKSKLTYKR